MAPLENEVLYVADSRNGEGVFAKIKFSLGDIILTFRGRLLDYHRVNGENSNSYEAEHCLQISKQQYIGASCWIDDYINHSCDPNSGIRKIGERFVLIAIREIILGEEITFDYSTYMDENNYEIDCNCGTSKCRSRVRDFKYLPSDLQHHYHSLNVVGEFIDT